LCESSYYKSRDRLLRAGRVSHDKTTKMFAPTNADALLHTSERGGA
jgi:hypothetical protein